LTDGNEPLSVATSMGRPDNVLERLAFLSFTVPNAWNSWDVSPGSTPTVVPHAGQWEHPEATVSPQAEQVLIRP
jgi:hypothetical protein